MTQQIISKSPWNFRLNVLSLFLALAMAGYAIPGLTQPAVEMAPKENTVVLPIKAISAELIVLSEPVPMYFSGKTEEVSEGLFLKTAVFSRDVARFPPSANPFLLVGQSTYPIFKTEISNWDIIKEQPIDENLPVGEIEFHYFLIPDWQSLEPRTRFFLAIGLARDTREMEITEDQRRKLDLLPGALFFDVEMIRDSREDD